MASDKVIELDSTSFEDAIQGDTPILVDFWASWCRPCQMVAPVLDELADEMDGQVRVGKIDLDANQEIGFKYQVSSIPAFLLFKDGEMVDRMAGAMPKASFKKFLDQHVAADTAEEAAEPAAEKAAEAANA